MNENSLYLLNNLQMNNSRQAYINSYPFIQLYTRKKFTLCAPFVTPEKEHAKHSGKICLTQLDL